MVRLEGPACCAICELATRRPSIRGGLPESLMDQSYSRERLKELRTLVGENQRVAILLQDDPDPDAIASGIALRTLLGRNKLTTPLFSFSDITRPENRAMVQLLEIEVVRASRP